MTKYRFFGFIVIAAVADLAATTTTRTQVEYVDPTIGGLGFLLEPTRPTIHLPNSVVRVYPVRRDQLDDQIRSFPLTIISHRLGELFSFMPLGGPLTAGEKERPAAYDQEITKPYRYSVRFDGSLIQTAFAPASHSGYFRVDFPSGQPRLLLGCRQVGSLRREGESSVSGVEQFHGMQAYFYGEFSAPVEIVPNGSENTAFSISAQPDLRRLDFKYGISFISVEQAKINLQKEISQWDFDAVVSAAKNRWNEVLGQIKVEGGSEAQRQVFYTSLYRCYERMVNISEDGKYYSGFDHKVHVDERPFYVDNWLWDNYRALQPLHTILNPQMTADQIASYVRMYEQSGWMPSFAVLWGDYACMTGNHAAAWVADAWFKGIRDFDLSSAYKGIRKNSLEATLLPWRNGPKTSLDEFYAGHGYMPALRPGEKETVAEVHSFERRQSISVTLGQSYDDWCAAQLARGLGEKSDYGEFMKRAQFYKNVFRQEKNFMWPKDTDGKWIEPFDPKFSGGQGGRDYTTENNVYTYDWDVQHDVAGLVELMGGRAHAEAKLDTLFREELGRSRYALWATFPDATGLVGQFSMGNEPSFHIPYLYNHLGAPWKTQKRIRMLLDTWFTNTYLGIPGDEDGGGTCAFVVFSMMGFYPVTPGIPVYEFGSPVFDRVTIQLPDAKTFEISSRNNSKDNKYIGNRRLNGEPTSRVGFRHADLMAGGKIELDMQNTPNLLLGAAAEDYPPSGLDVDPSAYSAPSGK